MIEFGGVVQDAGGGIVKVLVDRDTPYYPEPGDRAKVIITPLRPVDEVALEIGRQIVNWTRLPAKERPGRYGKFAGLWGPGSAKFEITVEQVQA